MRLKTLTLTIFLFITSYWASAQYLELSDTAEVSVLTIAEGSNLYDSFGHSAIRIKDSGNSFDKVYNYGVYDFNTPNFYIKFMRGKLLYDLGTAPTHYFLRSYVMENREVKAQVLALNKQEKQAYYEFLENNAKPENRKYLYDFFFDNCATRIRDVNSKVLREKVNYHDELLQSDFTFRQLVAQKLTDKPWSKFGIDIALGAVIDRKATPKETTFLPSYVFDNFKNARIDRDGKEQPLVERTISIFKPRKEEIKKESTSINPFWIFTLLAMIIGFLTYKEYQKKAYNKWLDFSLLLVTGLIGLVIFLLWFATDHSATANNFNILWAMPLNIFAAFYLLKKEKGLKNYYLILLLLTLILLILWVLKIQIFNVALIPILLFLSVRYIYNWRRLSNVK